MKNYQRCHVSSVGKLFGKFNQNEKFSRERYLGKVEVLSSTLRRGLIVTFKW